MKEKMIQELINAADNFAQIGITREIDTWDSDTLEFIVQSVYVYDGHVEICGDDGEHLVSFGDNIDYDDDNERYAITSDRCITYVSL